MVRLRSETYVEVLRGLAQKFGAEMDGPLGVVDDVRPHHGGIYIIVGEPLSAFGTEIHIVDVGQSGQIGTRLADHPRSPCWQEFARKNPCRLRAIILYTPGWDKMKRENLEGALRLALGPVCGIR
jgi:hypothetical protein